jgi:hypothetical protein
MNIILRVVKLGMAVDRVWSGYPWIWVCGSWVWFRFSPTGLRIWISATLWVWAGFYISPADIHWSSEKLIPINPHKEF